jgi:radical SAM superfamily enzyme YgiQ (UPF0313 family)
MARILLTHSYFLNLDPKQEEAGNAYPPLGTLYAAAFLREQGHDVALFDAMLASGPDQLLAHMDADPSLKYLVLYEDGFNYLTKMCLTNMREAAFQMIRLGKARGLQVLVSGSDSTDHKELYLDAGADVVILGEGEITLSEWIAAREEGKEPKEIAGLAYRINDAEVTTGKRPVLRDLDVLPFPAWDLIDFEPYRKLWLEKAGFFSLNIVSSRGCTFKCNWCAKPIFGNRYHARTPAQVLEEINYLIRVSGATYFWFCDDIFGLKPGWLAEFARIVQASGTRFQFKIQSRADLMTDENAVQALAAAGCDTVWLGAESGSQKILDAMDKGITLSQIRTSRALLRKHGIKTAFFLQFGYPGENMDDIQATIRMVLETMPDEIGISVTYPLPGTRLYELVREELVAKSNWSDSDDLAMMFKNTYAPGFYKELQRYMHTVYRQRKSRLAWEKWRSQPNLEPSLIRASLLTLYHTPMAWWRGRKLASFPPQNPR